MNIVIREIASSLKLLAMTRKIMAQAENLDSRLLRNQGEEQEAAKELKEEKRGQAGEEGGDEADETGEPLSLRQRVQAARQALDLKKKAKDKLEEKVAAPAKLGTSRVLQWAWLTLIPSWGLTLIYINIHVFLKSVFGEKLFCKLGEEWIPKQIAGAGSEAGKSLGKSIGIIEVMGLLFLDLVVLLLIIIIFSLLTLITSFLGAGFWEKIKWVWDAVGVLGWSAVSALVDLFKNFK